MYCIAISLFFYKNFKLAEYISGNHMPYAKYNSINIKLTVYMKIYIQRFLCIWGAIREKPEKIATPTYVREA